MHSIGGVVGRLGDARPPWDTESEAVTTLALGHRCCVRRRPLVLGAVALGVSELAGPARTMPVRVNSNLVTGRTRLVNQLYALLRDLPGGARTDVTAAPGARLLAGMRPAGPVESARKRLGRDLLAEIGDVERRIKIVTDQIATAVSDTGTSLLEVDGIGPVLAGPVGSRPRRRSLATPGSLWSRSLAPSDPGIACRAAGTDN